MKLTHPTRVLLSGIERGWVQSDMLEESVKLNEEFRGGLTQLLQSRRGDRRVWRIEIFRRHR